MSVLFPYLDKHVDEMVEACLVDEIIEFYASEANCIRRIRRTIGVPELQTYFEIENDKSIDEANKEKVLKKAIKTTKENTFNLAENQRLKIYNMVHKIIVSPMIGFKTKLVPPIAVANICGKVEMETLAPRY